jgi:hypothetical protein
MNIRPKIIALDQIAEVIAEKFKTKEDPLFTKPVGSYLNKTPTGVCMYEGGDSVSTEALMACVKLRRSMSPLRSNTSAT